MEGVQSYAKAWEYIRTLRLWWYFLVPAVISIALAVGIGATAWALSDNIGLWLAGLIPGAWGGKVIETIGQIFGGLLVGAAGLAVFKVLVLILAGPFMSPLSERIERHITGTPSTGIKPLQIVRDMVRGIRVNVRNLFWELTFTFFLIILGLLLPFLSPLTPVFIFLVQSYYAGFGNMDFTLERHFGYRDSIRFVRDFKGLALGNGAVYLLLLLSGIGFIFALPLGTIAATLDSVERIRPDEVKPDLI